MEAFSNLSEHYSKTIEIEPGLQSRKITASFNNQTFDEVVKILAITLNARIVKYPEKIILKTSN